MARTKKKTAGSTEKPSLRDIMTAASGVTWLGASLLRTGDHKDHPLLPAIYKVLYADLDISTKLAQRPKTVASDDMATALLQELKDILPQLEEFAAQNPDFRLNDFKIGGTQTANAPVTHMGVRLRHGGKCGEVVKHIRQIFEQEAAGTERPPMTYDRLIAIPIHPPYAPKRQEKTEEPAI